jgi:hypothetical protein
VAVLVGHVAAQQARKLPAGAGEPQIFVDVFVTGADGKPVLDLKPEELSLRINGRQRLVRSLTLEQFDGVDATSEWPPPFSTNRAAPERDILILIDNESFPLDREAAVKEGVSELLASLGRARVGLWTLPKSTLRIAPTRDHQRIQLAVNEMLARGLRTETESDAACRTKATLGQLKALVTAIRSPRLTTLVLFSGGLLQAAAMDPLRRNTGPASACDLRMDDFTGFERVLQGAPVDLHVALVSDASSASSAASASQVAGVEHLAGAGGSPLIRLRGSSRATMTRLANEISAYYVVGVDRDREDDLSVAPRVEARVSRADTTTRSMRSVSVSAVKPHQAGTKPADIVRDPVPYRDLPLRMAAHAAPDADPGKVLVLVVFEPTEPNVQVASAAVGLFDDTGRLAAQGTASPSELARAPFVLALRANPDSYRVRVGAIDNGGRLGAVDSEVSGRLVKNGPLVFSPLMFGVIRQGRFAPVMQFSQESPAVAYLEVRGLPAGADVSAECQVVASADSPAGPARPAAVRPGASGDQRIVICEIPLTDVSPGDSAVRVFVTFGGQSTSIVRTLRKAGGT